jgi:hypothetical protein
MFMWLLLTTNKSFAQQAYALDDITRVELITRAGGMTADARNVEVVRDENVWNSYQTNLIRGRIRSTSREFIKTVPEEQLSRLLALVAKGESAKDIEQFEISSAELIPYIDSLDANITSASRRGFVELLQNESVVKQAFNTVTTPFIMDDRTYYGISFLMKDGTTFTMEAYSFADPYYLPWQLGKAKSYDPAISVIFESLSGNDAFAITQKHSLNRRLVQDVYWKHLHRK